MGIGRFTLFPFILFWFRPLLLTLTIDKIRETLAENTLVQWKLNLSLTFHPGLLIVFITARASTISWFTLECKEALPLYRLEVRS